MPRELNPWPDADPSDVVVAAGAGAEPVGSPVAGGPAVGSTADARPYATLTVDEMIADDEAGGTAPLGPRLDAIRHTLRDGGVSVTVNLYGRLVDLTIDHRAMRMRATDLAAHLHRLTTEATAAALAEGAAVLAHTGITFDTAGAGAAAPAPLSSAHPA